MQRILSVSVSVMLFASLVFAQGGGGQGGGRQGGPPPAPVGLAAGQQQSYARVKGLVMGSANEMPEEGFAHKPADGIRTFAQLFAHISDFHYGTCSQASGTPNPRMGQPSLEMSVATKADVIKTLTDSYAFCDPAFAALTDQSIAELIMGGRGGPRARGAILSQLLEHDNEMYGVSTVYLRTNMRVPPASQGRGGGPGGGGGRRGGEQGAPPAGRGQ